MGGKPREPQCRISGPVVTFDPGFMTDLRRYGVVLELLDELARDDWEPSPAPRRPSRRGPARPGGGSPPR